MLATKQDVGLKTKTFLEEVIPILRQFSPVEQLEFYAELIAFANRDSQAIIAHVIAVDEANKIQVPNQELILSE